MMNTVESKQSGQTYIYDILYGVAGSKYALYLWLNFKVYSASSVNFFEAPFLMFRQIQGGLMNMNESMKNPVIALVW